MLISIFRQSHRWPQCRENEQCAGKGFQQGRRKFHSTIRVASIFLIANSVPAYACSVSVEMVNSLNFGQMVSPSQLGAVGWVRINLDGSYTLSSHSLSPQASVSHQSVELGLVRIEVEGAEAGSEIGVEISSATPDFKIFPDSIVNYHLTENQSSGVFYLNYGGQLYFNGDAKGLLLGDLQVRTSCHDGSDAN